MSASASRTRRTANAANNLTVTHPHLAAQWADPDRQASQFTAGSDFKALWECHRCAHTWRATIGNRAKGAGCPQCAGKVATAANNLTVTHPHLAAQWADPDRQASQFTAGSGFKALWECRTCAHRWRAAIGSRAHGAGCPQCARASGAEKLRRASAIRNLSVTHLPLASQWADPERRADEFTAGSGFKALWECHTCAHRWRAAIGSRANGAGCPVCAGNAVGATNNLTVTHPELVKEWAENDRSPEQFSGRSTYYASWECRTGQTPCGHHFKATILSRARDNAPVGCPACAGKVANATNNLRVTHPYLADEWDDPERRPEQFTARSGEKVWWCCRASARPCGHRWQATIRKRARPERPTGCPACAGRATTPANSLTATHPHLARELADPVKRSHELTAGSGYKALWICAVCAHQWRAVVQSRTGGAGCPACANKVATATNNLCATHPHLAAQWADPEREAHEFTAGSSYRPLWECRTGEHPCGHRWRTAIANRVALDTGCPACVGQVATPSNCLAHTHPQLAQDWADEDRRACEVTSGSAYKALWECRSGDHPCGYRWRATVNSRAGKKVGCPQCNGGFTRTTLAWLLQTERHAIAAGTERQRRALFERAGALYVVSVQRSVVEAIIRSELTDEDVGAYIDGTSTPALDRVEAAHCAGLYGGKTRLSSALRAFVFDRDGWACLACATTKDLSCDHYPLPESKGGLTVAENLRTLCRLCNRISATKALDLRQIRARREQLGLPTFQREPCI